MAEDQRKVRLIAEFLKQSFVECSVLYDHEDKFRVAWSYQIVDEATGKLLHYAFVSLGFLDDHADAEVVPAPQSLGLARVSQNRRHPLRDGEK